MPPKNPPAGYHLGFSYDIFFNNYFSNFRKESSKTSSKFQKFLWSSLQELEPPGLHDAFHTNIEVMWLLSGHNMRFIE